MTRLLALALALAAAGCATQAGVDDTDKAKMSLVERTAADRGVKVYWVNPPRKAQSPEATKPGG